MKNPKSDFSQSATIFDYLKKKKKKKLPLNNLIFFTEIFKDLGR